ncbi:hypothetical protein WNB94_11165 [Aquabacterium sp. A3]|uniref:hypothetical protein n=1 Tax=Aquabacterium sp. A3 TaxID=3132829 RepID=UPI003119333E
MQATRSAHPLSTTARLAAAVAMAMAVCIPAQAQWVPHSGHVWRQAQAQVNTLTTATVHLHAQKSQAPQARPVAGQGLSLGRWAGRAGVALDRDVNPVKDSYVLAQPAQHGLKMRSLHILSDLELGSGFRASAGVVKGDITQAWWGEGDAGGGLQLSVQQLDRLGLLGMRDGRDDGLRPYLGAGYSVSQDLGADHSTWHFSADLGVTPQGSEQRSGGEGLRLNPVLKLSMRYSF